MNLVGEKITNKINNHKIPAIFLFILLAIALISLASIGDVSANPGVIYVNDSSGNDSWDGESDVWDGIGTVGPKKSIKNATGTVTDGGIVNIADGVYSGENNNNITLDKNMTIQGQSREGTILDGTNAAQIFLIKANITVILQNLTITNGNGSSGGAISNNGTLSLSETEFTYNNAEFGGAILNFGNMNIDNSKFMENTAINSVISSSGVGGAIFNYGNLTVNNTIFYKNSATSNTYISAFGGAICNAGDLKITHSVFNDNQGIGLVAGSSGGAIGNIANLTINDIEFVNNEANTGGAIDTTGNLTANKIFFSGNSAVAGGAVSNQGNGTLSNCEFLLNVAEYGGAVYNIGNLTINANNFTNNSVNSLNNDTGCFGGAIFTGAGTLILNLSKFINNMAQSSYKDTTYCGGAISNYEGTTAMNNCEFSSNAADSGGAISNMGNLTIKNTIFTENIASSDLDDLNFDGGAISNYGNSSIYESIFTDNYADLGGTISNWDNSTVNVSGSTFKRNGAYMNGDVFYNEGILRVHFCQIMENGIEGYYPEDIFNEGGVVDARYNWWGSNQNPSDRVVDSNVSSWLVLRLTPGSASIKNGGFSVLTADLIHDINGVYHDPAKGHVPDGIVVKFTSNLGTIGTTYMATTNGVAISTLKGGSKAGWADVAAITGSQSIHKSVKIDLIPPKVTYTYPKKYATGVSRTKTIYLKFSENIRAGINWSKIVVKDKYGRIVKISKWISGNTLYIKTSSKRSSNSYYTVYIPSSAINDLADNGLAPGYVIKFKTGRY